MRKNLTLGLSFLLLTVFSSCAAEFATTTNLDPEQILKKLVPEVPDIKMVPPEDLEPNPQGEYRRHAFIQGNFNGDGQEDIAICGTDEWVREGRSLMRNGYVLIASKKKDGTWVRQFFHKFPGTAYPFLIWDKKIWDKTRMALLVGANFSDSNPGDIVWDPVKKEYKLVQVIEK
jgi:hypothetical protein